MFKKVLIAGLLGGIVLVLIAFGTSCKQTDRPSLTQQEADSILSIYSEARNTANLELLDGIFDTNVVIHDCGSPKDIHGLDELKSFYEESHRGLPDFKIAFDDVLVSGDKIIDRWTITATHTGSLRGIPPTGKAVRFSGLAIDRVANGKIVEEWVSFNLLDLMLQLGFSLTPPPSPAGT